METTDINYTDDLKAEQLRILDAENQLYPEMVGSGSDQIPLLQHSASARLAMGTKYLGSAIWIESYEQAYFSTFAESQLARFTFGVKMPHDGTVVGNVAKYVDCDNNPKSLMIYEYYDERAERVFLDYLEIHAYVSNHKQFGYKMDIRPEIHQPTIAKDTVLTEVPHIDDNGMYCVGRNVVVAFMGLCEATEDGVLVCTDLVNELGTTIVESSSMVVRHSDYMLDTFGVGDEVKTVPSVGDIIPDHGIVMGTRKVDPLFDHIGLLPASLRMFDDDYDDLVYGIPGAEVIDVTIIKNHNTVNAMPNGTDKAPEWLAMQDQAFHKRILDIYRRSRAEKGNSVVLSEKLDNLIAMSYARVPGSIKIDGRSGVAVKPKYRAVPTEVYHVNVTYSYRRIPNLGAKTSTRYGGKGVFTQMWPKERMPTNGLLTAQMVFEPGTTSKRQITSALYEQFYNLASLIVAGKVKEIKDNGGTIEEQFDCLLEYLKVVAPEHYDIAVFVNKTDTDKKEYLVDVIGNMVRLYRPTHSVVNNIECVKKLMEMYDIVYTPVSYIGANGKKFTTKNRVMMGHIYVMMLDKIGDYITGTVSPSLLAMGIPGKTSAKEKHSRGKNSQGIKITGETEVRWMHAAIGAEKTRILMNRINSPKAHKECLSSIYEADDPSVIKMASAEAEKDYVSRVGELIRHIDRCQGLGWYDTTEEIVYD